MEMIEIWTDSLFIELLNDINKEVWCCRSFSEMVAERKDVLLASLE